MACEAFPGTPLQRPLPTAKGMCSYLRTMELRRSRTVSTHISGFCLGEGEGEGGEEPRCQNLAAYWLADQHVSYDGKRAGSSPNGWASADHNHGVLVSPPPHTPLPSSGKGG